MVNFTLRPLYPRGKKMSVKVDNGAGWAAEPGWKVWKRETDSAGFRTPICQARMLFTIQIALFRVPLTLTTILESYVMTVKFFPL